MAFDGSHDSTHERPVDARALRFALIFPLLLSVALFLGGFLIKEQLPDGVLLLWGAAPIPVGSSLGIGAALIVLVGAGVGSQGARTSLPAMSRRILLGVGMTLQLDGVAQQRAGRIHQAALDAALGGDTLPLALEGRCVGKSRHPQHHRRRRWSVRSQPGRTGLLREP